MVKLAVEDVDAEILAVGDGVLVPRSWVAVMSEQPGPPAVLRAGIVYDTKLRRAVADWVRVDRRSDGEEVTTTLLRDVRVQMIVQVSASALVRVERGGSVQPYLRYLDALSSEQRNDEQNLREAARLYRIGAVINYGPLKLVSEQLGVSVSTATRMMNRARAAGLVDEVTGRELLRDARERELRGDPSRPAVGPEGGPGSAMPTL